MGAKRLGYGGETTRVENRGETTRGKRLGGNVLGAKRLVTRETMSLYSMPVDFTE